MQKRQWLISGILTLVILLGAALAFQVLKAKKTSTVSDAKPEVVIREVNVAQFAPTTLSSEIALDGRLSAYEKVSLGSEVTGRLLSTGKNHKIGSYFSKGDLLFQVANSDEQLSLYAQRSSLLNAITQIMPDLKFDHPQSFDSWKRYLDEMDVKSVLKELPKPQTDKEKYYIAGKNIYNLYYSIKSAEDRMGNYNIYAPFSGVFLSVSAYPGSLVTPGMTLGQLMNTSRFEMVAPLAMDDIKYVSTGQKVSLSSESLGATWTGSVSRISNQLDQATQSIPVYISVTGKGLRDGVFLKGTLAGKELSGVSEIPRAVIIDQNHVWVYQNGKAVKKALEIVARKDQQVIVKGLSETDQVITSGVNNIYSGQELSLRKS